MDFKEYVDNYAQRYKVFWAGGIPWSRYRNVLRPLSHPHVEPNFHDGELNKLLKESKAPFAMWTYDFDSSESEWWWLIARRPYSLEILDSKTRYNIRHGLKKCEVKIISAKLLADIGYRCYESAMRRRTQQTALEEASFKKRIPGYDNNKSYEIWGVFMDNVIIGYAFYKRIDDVVYEESTIFDPLYYKYHLTYALIHTVSDYYLNDKKCQYMACGWRSISHETEFQKFTTEKFKRKKVHCRLGIDYSPSFNAFVNVTYYLKPIWSKIFLPQEIKHKLNTIHLLEKIKRNQLECSRI